MSGTRSLYARVSRRETHSPRALVAIVLAVVLIVVFAWIGTEIVIHLLGLPALLVAPADMLGAAVGLAAAPVGIVATAGILVAVAGLILVVVAVAPGRRARHLLDTERAATVVDNEVVASALARAASLAGDVDPDNTTVSVSHRRAVVRLIPTSGVPVNRQVVAEAVDRQLDGYGLRPAVRASIQVSDRAKVGA